MALVRKILETTLTAGSTSVTFTDTDIPNSLLRVYCTKASLFPLSQTLSGNSLSVNYKPQDSNIGVALEIVKQGLDIVDGLESEDATKALSANQGYVLKGLIDSIVIPTVPENITDLNDVSITSIQDGQILAWDSLTEKFENITPSVSSGNDYSTTETEIGTWINGEKLYRRVIPITQDWSFVANTWVKSNIPVGNIALIENARVVLFYNSVYSLHFVQIGVVDGYIAGNCFRNFSAAANRSALVIEYTKS